MEKEGFMMSVVFRIEGNKLHLASLASRNIDRIVVFELAVPLVPCRKAECNCTVVKRFVAVAVISW